MPYLLLLEKYFKIYYFVPYFNVYKFYNFLDKALYQSIYRNELKQRIKNLSKFEFRT